MIEPLVIIACAGNQVRWCNHGNRAKQMALVGGQPLIHRTISQLVTAKLRDIIVLGFDPQFVRPPARLHVPTEPNPLMGTAIGHSVQAWNRNSDTLLLMGDVIWGDWWLGHMPYLLRDEITFIGNQESGPKKNPEIMAVYIPVTRQPQMLKAIVHVARHRLHDVSGGWQVYRALHGLDPREHKMAGWFLQVPDDCADIDTPEDYTNYKDMMRKKKRGKRC